MERIVRTGVKVETKRLLCAFLIQRNDMGCIH